MVRRNIKIIFVALLFVVTFSSFSFAGDTRRVSTAKEFQKALDDGITDIIITSSFSGNFVIPRWVSSISGSSLNIVISPSDESKAVFDAESSTKKNLVRAAEVLIAWPIAVGHALISESTSDSLKFSNLTIRCGTHAAIDTNSISKPVTISKVAFKGVKDYRDKFTAFYPSTTSTVDTCTFENVMWAVSTIDTADYKLTIKNCYFKNVGQALSVSNSGSGARASIENCKGENLSWWVIQHEAGNSIMYVTVDQNSIDSSRSDFYHKTLSALNDSNRYSSNQFDSYLEDLSRHFKALPDDAKTLIFSERRRGWDNMRIFAMTELNKKLRELDPSDKNHKAFEECLSLYALLASAPVASLFNADGSVEKYGVNMYMLCSETLKNCVKEDILLMPIIRSFLDSEELAPFTRTGIKLSWGKIGNVGNAFATKIEQTPDRIFRENLHKLQDWLSALQYVKEQMNQAKNSLYDDYAYLTEFEKKVRNIYDLGIASNRVACAIFFDLPVDVAFASNFARVSNESSVSKITGACRELGSFHSVSQRLCVLNRTNTLRNELLKIWKNKLVETHLFGSDDHSRYEELLSSLRGDPDIMRDSTRLNDFFREWR